MLIRPYTGTRELKVVYGDFNIIHDGTLTDSEGKECTLEEFRTITGIEVYDVNTLILVGHQFFNWPPIYWPLIKAVSIIDGLNSPENLLATISSPVESLEYPGFFLIPYYSNYLISRDGTLLKKASCRFIKPSKAVSEYYTYRMCNDSENTQNRHRHRILAMAFLPYNKNMEIMQINHINGIKGDDRIENLEWVTQKQNIKHEIETGLVNNFLVEVEVRDVFNNKVFIFPSYSSTARFFKVEPSTVATRCKSSGHQIYDGFQFRHHPSENEWPEIDPTKGKFKVEFPSGDVRYTGCKEAARHAGLTPTSLLRMLREGRYLGPSGVKVFR